MVVVLLFSKSSLLFNFFSMNLGDYWGHLTFAGLEHTVTDNFTQICKRPVAQRLKQRLFLGKLFGLLNNLLVPTIKKYLLLHSCKLILSKKTYFVNWLGHVFQDQCFGAFWQSRSGGGLILYWCRNPLKIIESLSGEDLLYRKYIWKYIANIWGNVPFLKTGLQLCDSYFRLF